MFLLEKAKCVKSPLFRRKVLCYPDSNEVKSEEFNSFSLHAALIQRNANELYEQDIIHITVRKV